MLKVVLIRPAVFLHERFESTPILGKIKWRLLREHGISRFAGFLENKIFLETLIVIFVNSSPKGLTWPNMKEFDFSVLTLNSRYLQSVALKTRISPQFRDFLIFFVCKSALYQSNQFHPNNLWFLFTFTV